MGFALYTGSWKLSGVGAEPEKKAEVTRYLNLIQKRIKGEQKALEHFCGDFQYPQYLLT